MEVKRKRVEVRGRTRASGGKEQWEALKRECDKRMAGKGPTERNRDLRETKP